MIEKTKLIHRDLIEGNLVMIDNEESWPQLKGKVLKIVDSYIAKSKLITANFPKSKRIVIVVDEDGTEYDQLDEFIRPIPLSEDVLIKFTHDGRKFSSGFTSDPQERPASKRYELSSFEINQTNEDEQIFDVEICGCIIELKFVHDLQNAFWLFNKEELIYTP